MDGRPGRLKKYEILRPLAAGGMAEVHLARTTGPHGIEKLVVIKRLLPELAANEQFVRMFLEEARLAVALDHANIVQVHDVDEVDGDVFYVMEFLHGRDVRQIARVLATQHRRMPIEHAVTIVLSMCAALHYAHEVKGPNGEPLGVVHRDVSPHNVFVRFDGVVKVIDFGIAKANNQLERTATGMLRGKFAYMSPEQCLQQPLDRRSDVFSIGIVLYELTTGRRLYHAPNEYETLKRIVETEPERPSARDPGYPPALERILMKALARDRAARHATAEELQLELEAIAREAGMSTATRSLARFMEALFRDDVAAWRDAQDKGGLFVPPAQDDVDDEAETRTQPPSVLPLPIATADLSRDDTKSASVTETLAPTKSKLGPARIAIIAALSAAAVIALIVSARSTAPQAAAAPAASTEPVAIGIAPSAPPPPAAPPSASAEVSATAESPATVASAPARATRIAPRSKQPPSRRAPSSAKTPALDPDAPLPH